MEHLLMFTLADQHYALRLRHVERIVRAVAIMPLPETPPGMLGVINLQGQIVPVISLRQRFHLPIREIELDDRFIIAQTTNQTIALLVDTVIGVVDAAPEQIVPPDRSTPGLEYSSGMLKVQDNMVLLPDIEKLMIRHVQ